MTAAIQDLIRQKAIAAGIDPIHALTIASIETGGTFNPRLTSPTGYKGLFQFGPREWASYGKGDIFDPEANIDAFIAYRKDIKDEMTKALGREPKPWEIYLGWQQGAGGGSKLLQNPELPASSVTDAENIRVNGGNPSMAASDFANQWAATYGQHENQVSGLPPPQYVSTPPEWQQRITPDVATVEATLPPVPTPSTVRPRGLLETNKNPFWQAQGGLGLLSSLEPRQLWQPIEPPNLLGYRPQGEITLPNFRRGLLG